MPFSRLRPHHAQGQAQTHNKHSASKLDFTVKMLCPQVSVRRQSDRKTPNFRELRLIIRPIHNVKERIPCKSIKMDVQRKLSLRKPIICDYHLSTPTQKIGGGERVRTDDLLLAKQVLSQLSYAPEKMVGLGRLELPTSRLSGVRSNQAELQARTVQKPPRKMSWH